MHGYFLHITLTQQEEIMLGLDLLNAKPHEWGGQENIHKQSRPPIENVLCGWSKFNIIEKNVSDDRVEYLMCNFIPQEYSYMPVNDFIEFLVNHNVQVKGMFLGKAAHPSKDETPGDFFFYKGKTLIVGREGSCEWLFIPGAQEKERVLTNSELYAAAGELYFIEHGKISSLTNFVKTVDSLYKEFTENPPLRRNFEKDIINGQH